MKACIAVVLAGCFYGPGSYHDTLGPFPGKRVELACLDLAVTLTQDALAPDPVVEYSFGNRCTHSTVVDLASVPAIGRYADGTVRDLHPRDPKHELAALPIDAWWHGEEEISYEAADRGAPDVVCIDAGHIDRSGDGSPHWVCMQ
jgi:hypothetical protein